MKMKTDPDYRAAKRMSQHKWVCNHSGYWKAYRKRNPEKAERNRMLQTIRNRRRQDAGKGLIAKIDASKGLDFQPVGQFWLVPMIAKLDATKVNIYTITGTWQ